MGVEGAAVAADSDVSDMGADVKKVEGAAGEADKTAEDKAEDKAEESGGDCNKEQLYSVRKQSIFCILTDNNRTIHQKQQTFERELVVCMTGPFPIAP